MAVNTVFYTGANSGRGPSKSIWKSIRIAEILEDREKGFFHHEDFLRLPPHSSTSGGAVSGAYGGYQAYLYQGGAIADAALPGGGVVMSSDGDNEGAAIGPYVAGARLNASYGRFAFECSVKTSTITDTKHGLFAGLIEPNAIGAGVPLATDGTLADKNFVGFHRLEGDGDMLDVVWKADGQTQVSLITDAVTLVADTWMKIGIVFDPDAPAAQRLKFFKDGTALTTYGTATQMAAVTFPSDINLGPVFAVMNATGTTPGNSTVRWWQMAQEYIS